MVGESAFSINPVGFMNAHDRKSLQEAWTKACEFETAICNVEWGLFTATFAEPRPINLRPRHASIEVVAHPK